MTPAEVADAGSSNTVLLPPPPPMEPGAQVFAPSPVVYAGFWRRVLAYIIDAMITGVSANLAAAVIGVSGSEATVLIGVVLILLAYCAYYVLLNANGQQTIGKRVAGIRVVQENGDDLSYGLAGLRLLASILSWVTMLLGVLWPIWDRKKQTFHDKIALTVVVKT